MLRLVRLAVFTAVAYRASAQNQFGDGGDKDYYAILGVDKEADEGTIKKTYRKLALKWHPDKNPDNREEAEKMFRDVAEAYEVLSKPDTRKQYDNRGQGGFGGFDFGDFGGFGGGFQFHDANDVFKDFFGGGDPWAEFDHLFDSFDHIQIDDDFFGSGEGDPFAEFANFGFGGQEQHHQQHNQQHQQQHQKAHDPFAAFADFGFGDLGGGFGGGFGFEGGFGGGGGASFSFSSSSSFSSGGDGTFHRTETKIGPDGKRVTKTVSGTGNKANTAMYEEIGADGKVRRKQGHMGGDSHHIEL